MKELFKKLFKKWNCNHEYKTIESLETRVDYEFGDKYTRLEYIQNCIHCNKIRVIKNAKGRTSIKYL